MPADKLRFMRRAIALSRQGMEAGEGGPFGAVIVKDGVIIGEGWNRVLASNDPTAHAEIEAIRAASRHLNTFCLRGCEIFTSAEPCPMCLAAVYWARLERIYFANCVADAAAIGFDDHHFYQQHKLPLGKRMIPEERLLAEEAVAVFREYAAKPGRVAY